MDDTTLNPVRTGDVLVLLAILGRYEGDLRGGAVDEQSVATLAARCIEAGLLSDDDTALQESVAAILEAIGQRLRYAIGEYPTDPTSQP